MRLSDYDTSEKFAGTVVSNKPLTSPGSPEEIRQIVLQLERKHFKFQVGQSIGVLAPSEKDFGSHEHLRLYSIANVFDKWKGRLPLVEVCVKRHQYIDEYNGERYDGRASNFLCDLKPGESVQLAGPYGLAFEIPEDETSDLIMIGLSTGIAPFRAYLKYIYGELGGWKGKVLLFYGARSGLEMLYMNDENDDLAQFYDRDTFEAVKALSPRPHWDDPIALDYALEARAEEILNMLMKPNTHVYVAGLEKLSKSLNACFVNMLGSEEKWQRRKAELEAGKRWIELLY